MSVDHVRRGNVRGALATLLEALAIDPVHGPSLDAATRICRLLGAPDDATLFEAVAERPDDAEALLLLGHRLVDQGRPEAALAFLNRARRQDPESVPVRRELAFARLLSRDFAGAQAEIGPLLDDPDLAEKERLDLLLMAAEAALYAGQRGRCRDWLAQADDLVPDDDQRQRTDALFALLGRSAHFGDLTRATLRDWHFIQHAAVLLKTAGGYFEDGSLGGRFDHLALRIDMVAFLLQRAVELYTEFDVAFEIVVPAGDEAEPLARALAVLLGATYVGDVTERQGRTTLLVASHAAEFAPYVAGLAGHRPDLGLFALWMDWSRDCVVSPEVVGVLARRVLLPWEQRYTIDPSDPSRMLPQAGDARPAVDVAQDLIAAAAALPDDGGKAKDDFLAHYRPLRGELLLGNEDSHPYRRQFTHLSPVWTNTSALRAQDDSGGDVPDDPDDPFGRG